MKAFRTILCLALSLAIAGGAMADDEKKNDAKKGDAKKPAAAKGDAAKKPDAAKGKGKGRKAPALSEQLLRGVELTDEQKKAVAPIDAEFGPKYAELQKSQRSILTEEQLKAQQAAFAKIKEAGKQATPEQRKELASVVKLSDEQKAKQAEIRKAQNELRTAYLAKVSPILTDDQKAKLKGPGADKKKRPAKSDAAGKKTAPKKDGDVKKTVKTDAA